MASETEFGNEGQTWYCPKKKKAPERMTWCAASLILWSLGDSPAVFR
jgi:hypothetical protein